MKILTIFTGGTIGSKLNADGAISPSADAPFHLLQLYKDAKKSSHEFITDEPYRILSENLNASCVLTLINCIKKHLASDFFDGIIITHGTDTLQYTAALLSYVFADSKIPILLVSSAFPLDDPRANGLSNFIHAVSFIEGSYGTGVFVSYENVDGICYIHRGTHLLSAIPYCADCYSFCNTWYGKFNGETFEKNPSYQESDSSIEKFSLPEDLHLSELSDQILRIIPYVGMQYPAIPNGTKVILHESYHSGTIGISDSLIAFAKEANHRQIPIYMTGLSSTEAEYETVEQYRNLGIIPLPESAPIAQYCKLWLALSNNLDLLDVMKTCIANDFEK